MEVTTDTNVEHFLDHNLDSQFSSTFNKLRKNEKRSVPDDKPVTMDTNVGHFLQHKMDSEFSSTFNLLRKNENRSVHNEIPCTMSNMVVTEASVNLLDDDIDDDTDNVDENKPNWRKNTKDGRPEIFGRNDKLIHTMQTSSSNSSNNDIGDYLKKEKLTCLFNGESDESITGKNTGTRLNKSSENMTGNRPNEICKKSLKMKRDSPIDPVFEILNKKNKNSESVAKKRKLSIYKEEIKDAVDHHGNKITADHHCNKIAVDHHGNKITADHHGNKIAVDHHGNKITADHHCNKIAVDHHSNKIAADQHGNKIVADHHRNKIAADHHGNEICDVYSFNEEDMTDEIDKDFSYKTLDKIVLHKRKKSANFHTNSANDANVHPANEANTLLKQEVNQPPLSVKSSANISSRVNEVTNMRKDEKPGRVRTGHTAGEHYPTPTTISDVTSNVLTRKHEYVDKSKEMLKHVDISNTLLESLVQRDKRLEAIRKVSLWIDNCADEKLSLVDSDTPPHSHWSTRKHLHDKDDMSAVLSRKNKNLVFPPTMMSSAGRKDRLVHNSGRKDRLVLNAGRTDRLVHNAGRTVHGIRGNSLTGSPQLSSSSTSDGLVSDVRSMTGFHSNSSSGSPVFPLSKVDGLVFIDGECSRTTAVSELNVETSPRDWIAGICANKYFRGNVGTEATSTPSPALSEPLTLISSVDRAAKCDRTKGKNIKRVNNELYRTRHVGVHEGLSVNISCDRSAGTSDRVVVDKCSSKHHDVGKHSGRIKCIHNSLVNDSIREIKAAEKLVVLDSCDTTTVPFDWSLEQNIGTYSCGRIEPNTSMIVTHCDTNREVKPETNVPIGDKLGLKVPTGDKLGVKVPTGVQLGVKQADASFKVSKMTENGDKTDRNDRYKRDAELVNDAVKIDQDKCVESKLRCGSISDIDVFDKINGALDWNVSEAGVNYVDSEHVYNCLNTGAALSMQSGSKINKKCGTQSKKRSIKIRNVPKGEIMSSNDCDVNRSSFDSNKHDDDIGLTTDVHDLDDNSLNLTTEDFHLAYQECLEKVYKLHDIDECNDITAKSTKNSSDSLVCDYENSLTNVYDSSSSVASTIDSTSLVSKATTLNDEVTMVTDSSDVFQFAAVNDTCALGFFSQFRFPMLTESQLRSADSRLVSGLDTSPVSSSGTSLVSGSGTSLVSGSGTGLVSGLGARLVSGSGTSPVSGSGTSLVSGSGTSLVSGLGTCPVSGLGTSLVPGLGTSPVSGLGTSLISGSGTSPVSVSGTSLDEDLINQSNNSNAQNGLETVKFSNELSKGEILPVSMSDIFTENCLVANGDDENWSDDGKNMATFLKGEGETMDNVGDAHEKNSDHDFVLEETVSLDTITEDYKWNETLKSFIMKNLDTEPKGEINEQDAFSVELLLEQKMAEQYLNRNIECLKRKNSVD